MLAAEVANAFVDFGFGGRDMEEDCEKEGDDEGSEMHFGRSLDELVELMVWGVGDVVEVDVW